MRDFIGYGLVSVRIALEIAKAVCDVLGHGRNGTAVQLLMETAAAETMIGAYPDRHTHVAGVGLTQVDEGTFDWLVEKYKSRELNEKLKESFGIDLAKLKYSDLALSPLLAFIFCRVRYQVVLQQIPERQADRAKYWKVHYNSTKGKGSPEEYLHRCKKAGINEIFENELMEEIKCAS